ncbi:MAG: hypothetical protein IJ723_01045, partial [Ruminococcus sp.]|nr:hypothetical protein [Ruminococcus sp.]
VETTKNFTGGRGARVHYWVDVKCESRGLHFKAYVDRYYYTRFAKYPGDTITFYRAENGPFFPTYIPNCDAKEAERELRHIQPPSGWYAAYCLMLLIAIGFLSIGGNGWRMMHSYSDKEEMLDILKVKYGDKQ